MYRVPIYKIQLVRDSSVASNLKKIACPMDVVGIVDAYLFGADREHLIVVTLDAKNAVIGLNTVSIGDLASAIASPREIFKLAILQNAAAIVLAHNHPSGDATPSSDDIAVTKRISEGGQILGIELIDHIVIGDNCHVSLKERALF